RFAAPAQNRKHCLALWLLAALAQLAYGQLGSQQWSKPVAPSWELEIITQLAMAYDGLDAKIVTMKGDTVILLGDHIHTMIDLLGTGLGSAAGAAYVFSFGLQAEMSVQFHEIAFAVPLLALSLTALLRGRVAATVAWAAPLVLVKEDLGLTVAVLGVIIALRQRSHRLEGAGLVCWGAGWFLVSTFLILPLLNAGGQYDYTDNLGSPLEIFWPPVKWLTLGMLLLAAGVIGARSPVVWMMLPTLAW